MWQQYWRLTLSVLLWEVLWLPHQWRIVQAWVICFCFGRCCFVITQFSCWWKNVHYMLLNFKEDIVKFCKLYRTSIQKFIVFRKVHQNIYTSNKMQSYFGSKTVMYIFPPACRCNEHGDTCNRETGRCNCHTKGVTGDHCDRCDTQNNYVGQPLHGSCFCEYSRLNYD